MGKKYLTSTRREIVDPAGATISQVKRYTTEGNTES